MTWRPWLLNRVPCLECGEIVTAAVNGETRCACGSTVVEGDYDGHAVSHAYGSWLPQWDRWDDDGDLVVVSQAAVAVAIRRAELAGRPFDAILALRTSPFVGGPNVGGQYDDVADYRGRTPTVVACADCESGDWPRAPSPEHIEAIIAFGRAHVGQRVLIHCREGLARSPAAALAIIADRLGVGHEPEAVEEVLRLRPCSIINLHMTRLADQALDRNGELWQAARQHPLVRARHSVRGMSEGWNRYRGLLDPDGGGNDMSRWTRS